MFVSKFLKIIPTIIALKSKTFCGHSNKFIFRLFSTIGFICHSLGNSNEILVSDKNKLLEILQKHECYKIVVDFEKFLLSIPNSTEKILNSILNLTNFLYDYKDKVFFTQKNIQMFMATRFVLDENCKELQEYLSVSYNYNFKFNDVKCLSDPWWQTIFMFSYYRLPLGEFLTRIISPETDFQRWLKSYDFSRLILKNNFLLVVSEELKKVNVELCTYIEKIVFKRRTDWLTIPNKIVSLLLQLNLRQLVGSGELSEDITQNIVDKMIEVIKNKRTKWFGENSLLFWQGYMIDYVIQNAIKTLLKTNKEFVESFVQETIRKDNICNFFLKYSFSILLYCCARIVDKDPEEKVCYKKTKVFKDLRLVQSIVKEGEFCYIIRKERNNVIEKVSVKNFSSAIEEYKNEHPVCDFVISNERKKLFMIDDHKQVTTVDLDDFKKFSKFKSDERSDDDVNLSVISVSQKNNFVVATSKDGLVYYDLDGVVLEKIFVKGKICGLSIDEDGTTYFVYNNCGLGIVIGEDEKFVQKDGIVIIHKNEEIKEWKCKILCDKNHLFVSGISDDGSEVLKLTKSDLKIVKRFPSLKERVSSFVLVDDGKSIILGSEYGKVFKYSTEIGEDEISYQLVSDFRTVIAFVFLDKDKYIVVGQFWSSLWEDFQNFQSPEKYAKSKDMELITLVYKDENPLHKLYVDTSVFVHSDIVL